MQARQLHGASDLRIWNRSSWTADDQCHWNGFLSVVIGSYPSAVQCSATASTSDVVQDKKRLDNLTDKLSSGTVGGCIGRQ